MVALTPLVCDIMHAVKLDFFGWKEERKSFRLKAINILKHFKTPNSMVCCCCCCCFHLNSSFSDKSNLLWPKINLMCRPKTLVNYKNIAVIQWDNNKPKWSKNGNVRCLNIFSTLMNLYWVTGWQDAVV